MTFYPHTIVANTGRAIGDTEGDDLFFSGPMTCLVIPRTGQRQDLMQPEAPTFSFFENDYGIYVAEPEYQRVKGLMDNAWATAPLRQFENRRTTAPRTKVWFRAMDRVFNPFRVAEELYEIQALTRFTTHIAMRVSSETDIF